MRAALALVWLVACRYDPLPRLDNDGNRDGQLGDSDGSTAQHASCASLTQSCGAGGTQSCCMDAAIGGGAFARNYDTATDGMHANMTYSATVSAFTIDAFEVTVGRFRAFVDAGMGTQANPPAAGAGARTLNMMSGQGGWSSTWNGTLAATKAQLDTALQCSPHQTWTDTPNTNDNLPINCVTWYEAQAFCIWDGGYLPTEAEWNFVAAQGAMQTAYPWSNPPSQLTIDCGHANYEVSAGTYCVPTMGNPKIVGATPLGDATTVSDLAGNVAEWTLDYYATLASTQYPNPCNDCALLLDGGLGRATRGGSYADLATGVRGASRVATTPVTRAPEIGFRCARP